MYTSYVQVYAISSSKYGRLRRGQREGVTFCCRIPAHTNNCMAQTHGFPHWFTFRVKHMHTNMGETSRRRLSQVQRQVDDRDVHALKQMRAGFTYQHSIRGLEPPHAAILLLIHWKPTLSEQVAHTSLHRSSRALKMENGCHCSTGLIADEIAQTQSLLQSYVGVMFALFCWRYGFRLNGASLRSMTWHKCPHPDCLRVMFWDLGYCVLYLMWLQYHALARFVGL